MGRQRPPNHGLQPSADAIIEAAAAEAWPLGRPPDSLFKTSVALFAAVGDVAKVAYFRGRTHNAGHHVSARFVSCAEARSMPEAAHCPRAVGAERRGIDRAEHSSTIERVMAVTRWP